MADTRQRRAWTQALGKRQLSDYERALCDSKLISLKQEIVKIDLRIDELHRRAKEGESKTAWKLARTTASELAAGLAATAGEMTPERHEKLAEKAEALRVLTERGVGDFALWDDLERLVELRRKLADTERKYEESQEYALPAGQVMLLFDNLLLALRATLQDTAVIASVLTEVRIRCNGEMIRGKSTAPLALPVAYRVEDRPDQEDAGAGETATLGDLRDRQVLQAYANADEIELPIARGIPRAGANADLGADAGPAGLVSDLPDDHHGREAAL